MFRFENLGRMSLEDSEAPGQGPIDLSTRQTISYLPHVAETILESKYLNCGLPQLIDEQTLIEFHHTVKTSFSCSVPQFIFDRLIKRITTFRTAGVIEKQADQFKNIFSNSCLLTMVRPAVLILVSRRSSGIWTYRVIASRFSDEKI